MMEESEAHSTARVTPHEMAEALAAVKAASPSLSGAIDAVGVTPEELAAAHDAVTPAQAATPAPDEGTSEPS
jgi:hypothetical protein